MRRIIRSLFRLAVTGATIKILRHFSRSRGMQRKVDQLQQKFRRLDNVGNMPSHT